VDEDSRLAVREALLEFKVTVVRRTTLNVGLAEIAVFAPKK